MGKSPQFTKEFKLKAVRLMRLSGRPAPEIARALGIARSSLWKWAVRLERHAGRPSTHEPPPLSRLCKSQVVKPDPKPDVHRSLSNISTYDRLHDLCVYDCTTRFQRPVTQAWSKSLYRTAAEIHLLGSANYKEDLPHSLCRPASRTVACVAARTPCCREFRSVLGED